MSDKFDLVERIIAATAAEQRLLLAEAFNLLFPEPTDPEPEWHGVGLRHPLFHQWYTRKRRFITLLDAEAYENAAFLLVPEGWHWTVNDFGNKASAYIINADNDMVRARNQFQATAALAITAVSLSV